MSNFGSNFGTDFTADFGLPSRFDSRFEKLLNPPVLFWQRLLLVIFACFSAYLALKTVSIPLPIDGSLLYATFLIFTIVGVFCFIKTLNTPFFGYIIAQLFFFWVLLDQFLGMTVHIPMKSRVIAFGFIFLTGLIYLFRNFDFLWKFTAFRFFFLFFLINIVYFFFHYSTFNVSLANFAGTGDMSENQDARVIIFLDSLAVLLMSAISLSLFKDIATKEQLKELIIKLAKVFSVTFALIMLIFAAIGKVKGLFFHISSPIYFMTLLTFKYYLDNFSTVSKWFNCFLQVVLLLFFAIPVLACNKATLISFVAALSVFFLLNFKEKIKIALSPVAGIVFAAGAIRLGMTDLVTTRLSNAFNSVVNGGINSFTVRQSNWDHLCDYWANHLDSFTTLFGFGLGKSREVMYYMSRSQYSSTYFVQTAHNQYMELFFDYGLVALLLFLPLVMIFWQNIKIVFSQKFAKEIKLLANLSLAVLVFYFIYHTVDGLRATTIITFFSILMFVEGFKYTYEKS